MLIIGVVGGVGSGKSLVAGQLRELGAEVLDVDRIGHQVLRERDVETAIGRRWGRAVLDDRGHVDRSALAQIVFAPAPEGPEQLALLERISHPRITQRLRQHIDRARTADKVDSVVLDAAVLFKAGWDRLCDKILFVDAPQDVRMQRCRTRGWSQDQFAAREAAQHPLNAMRRRADAIIDNSRSPEDTREQIQRFWTSLFL